MNKLSIFACAAALALTACNTTPATQGTSTTCDSACTTQDCGLAYVNVDRVLAECDLFQTEGLALQEKSRKSQEAWAKKEQGFQYEASQLQEKYQKGLITSANAQKQQASIERRIQNYQSSTQKEAKTLEEENFVFTNRAQDYLQRAIEELNSDKKYKMIINASALIDADSTLDQSQAVLDIVNKLYASEKETK